MRLRAVERDRVARADLVGVEADRNLESPRQDVSVLGAVVPHQRVGRGRLAAGRIAQQEEVDVVVGLRGEPFPADPRLQVDRRSVGAALDGRLRHVGHTGSACLGLHARWSVLSRDGNVDRRRDGVVLRLEHDLVDRQLELADHREQRVDRRLRLARLDLRDQAGGHSEAPRELAEPDVLLLARRPQPLPQVVAQALSVDGGPFRGGRSPPPLSRCRPCVVHIHFLSFSLVEHRVHDR